MRRIGPAMQRVVRYVSHHPGCSALACARTIGPHGSVQFGYRAIHRALVAGIIADDGRDVGRTHRYALVATGAPEGAPFSSREGDES